MLNRSKLKLKFLLKPASFEPCRPLMERAVLDWQDLSFAGFTDGSHVQLTVADWLRLGGGVERQVDPAAPDSGDLRDNYSDYSYSYSASEEEVEVEEGPAPPPPVVARASPPRLRSRTPPYPARGTCASPPRVSRSRSPLPRRKPEADRPHQTSPTPRLRRRRGGHRAGRKVQERRARAQAQGRAPDRTTEPEAYHRGRKSTPQGAPLKGQGKARRGGKGKGKGSSQAASASLPAPETTSPFATIVAPAQTASPFTTAQQSTASPFTSATRTTTRVPLTLPVPALNSRLPTWDWTRRR